MVTLTTVAPMHQFPHLGQRTQSCPPRKKTQISSITGGNAGTRRSCPTGKRSRRALHLLLIVGLYRRCGKSWPSNWLIPAHPGTSKLMGGQGPQGPDTTKPPKNNNKANNKKSTKIQKKQKTKESNPWWEARAPKGPVGPEPSFLTPDCVQLIY